ncbi:MAG: beta-ketoacyl-ACP synthase [Sandaracinaceae bacterium]
MRVVISGVGLVPPLGASLPAVSEALREGRTGVREQPAWGEIGGLATRVAGAVETPLARADRKTLRSMGRVAHLALTATEQALADAGLAPHAVADPRTGLAYGSTHGSSGAYVAFAGPLLSRRSFEGLPATSYLKFMSNTCAINLAQHYGIRGPVRSTCAACVSGSQAIGEGLWALRTGQADVMICGGAEELHWTHAGVFDLMMAASTRHPAERTPRPFDVDRDGLVVGEGAATVVLEPRERARARGAPIHAEVLGYGTNCDGTHVTQPSAEGMAGAMRLALADARLGPEDIGYVSAHATATEVGDIAESEAVHAVFGDRVPISSVKGAMGHTLGACGAIEAVLATAMMADGYLAPTTHLERVDPRCAPLDYVLGAARDVAVRTIMTNNFAFGGVNTSLVLGR